MKKIILSAAVAAMALSTSASAADKGIDIVTTGQAVIYYETKTDNGNSKTAAGANRGSADDVFSQNNSAASYAIQLDLAADLKNNFTFGTQLSYLGTAGLEKNLVNTTRQSTTSVGAMSNISDEIALTKIFIAKKVANTTIKLGRQALPKSLSPFAFSEHWNVLPNTFEAALVVNSDIPDTLVVGAYVSQSNGSKGGNFATFGNLKPKTDLASPNGVEVTGPAYMLTIQNKSIPMTTVTASYYNVAEAQLDTNTSSSTNALTTHLEGANAVWLDVAVADKSLPMGLKIGLQTGKIAPEKSTLADTTAYGIKASIKPIKALTLLAAYTSVDGDDNKNQFTMKNFGTGVKTPLFTQMIYNQDAISLDADTYMLKAVYNTGAYGKVIAQGTSTNAGKSNLSNSLAANGKNNDYTDLELIYKVKFSGMDLMAAYINRAWSEKTSDNVDGEQAVRVVARYKF